MDSTFLGGDMVAQRLSVGGDLSIRGIIANARFDLSFAQVGGNLYLGGGKVASLDLRGASIVGEMRLGDNSLPVKVDFLDLGNTHVGSLSDNRSSWPGRGRLHLDGFTFARLGGSEGDSSSELLGRGAEWWDDNWAQLDKDFSSSPYEQLAAAFSAAGERDAADEIHYRERVRADKKAAGWGSFIWSQFLRWGAGYGIGLYMFRALYWAAGLSVLGAVLLRFWANKGVAAANHGIVWCLGASVNQLLPVVTLKKEFKDFFDDPKLNQFTPRQDVFFVILAVLGWVLGGIVIAAIATITHS
jgi:hypothetical protein